MKKNQVVVAPQPSMGTSMLRRGSLPLSVTLVASVVLGCGGDPGAPPDANTPPDALVLEPGRIAIAGDDIAGVNGKIILANVTITGGGPSLGAVCVPVTSDPMSFTAVALTPAQGNPCDLGAEVVFADGSYDVVAGIYTPGQQTPDLCSNTTVTVAGTGEVTLPAFAACL